MYIYIYTYTYTDVHRCGVVVLPFKKSRPLIQGEIPLAQASFGKFVPGFGASMRFLVNSEFRAAECSFQSLITINHH